MSRLIVQMQTSADGYVEAADRGRAPGRQQANWR
jgi:hypothetical protein